jgi:hypothetical protein
MTNLLRQDQAKAKDHAIAAPPTAPATVERGAAKIDKSQLAIAEPKRLRDKAHLKFVACGCAAISPRTTSGVNR